MMGLFPDFQKKWHLMWQSIPTSPEINRYESDRCHLVLLKGQTHMGSVCCCCSTTQQKSVRVFPGLFSSYLCVCAWSSPPSCRWTFLKTPQISLAFLTWHVYSHSRQHVVKAYRRDIIKEMDLFLLPGSHPPFLSGCVFLSSLTFFTSLHLCFLSVGVLSVSIVRAAELCWSSLCPTVCCEPLQTLPLSAHLLTGCMTLGNILQAGQDTFIWVWVMDI